jgi:hypothetical protein
MSVEAFDVSASFALLANGDEGVHLKIASPQVEINVWLLPAEAEKLGTLPALAPELKSLRLGLSLGCSVHWSRDTQGRYYLLVGKDDETWDIGLTLDTAAFEAIVNAVAHPLR